MKKRFKIISVLTLTACIVGLAGCNNSNKESNSKTDENQSSSFHKLHVAKIQNSDLLVYNSPAIKTWVPSIKQTVSNVQFVKSSAGIDLAPGVEVNSKGPN
jgi:zinc transport system substrate-binding protein